MKICGYLKKDHIFFDLKSTVKQDILEEFVAGLEERGFVNEPDVILSELLQREKLCSTGLEKGIAVPHALTNAVSSPLLALAVLRNGVNFGAVDEKPTYVLLLLLGNKDNPGFQLKVLAHICRMVKETSFVERVRDAESASEVCRIITDEEGKME